MIKDKSYWDNVEYLSGNYRLFEKCCEDLDEDMIIDIVKINPFVIANLKEQSEMVCLAALQTDPNVEKYITNEKVILQLGISQPIHVKNFVLEITSNKISYDKEYFQTTHVDKIEKDLKSIGISIKEKSIRKIKYENNCVIILEPLSLSLFNKLYEYIDELNKLKLDSITINVLKGE